MKTECKCYRCGKIMDLTYKTIKQTMTCDHCHGTVTLDLPSQRKLKTVRFVFVAIVVLSLMYTMTSYSSLKDFVIFVFVMGISVTISLFADKLCLWLSANIFKLNYVEFHKPSSAGNKKKK